jgi:iron complex outermembrane receptor protein
MKYLKTQQRPIAALAACLITGNVWAQSSNSSDPISHVIVSTGSQSYAVENANSATRVSAPLIETPVSIDVVDQQVIQDRAILTPAELANVVSGVQQNAGYGNVASQDFIIRGFSSNGVNYRDGYRMKDSYTPRDMANVERVEFVKGPSSVLGGASQPGGSVNTITKKPLDYKYGYVGLQAGSYDFFRATADVNEVFGDVAVRLNMAADQGNSFVNYESSKNGLIAPTVKWKVNSDIEVLYAGEFQRTTMNGASNGLPNIAGVQNLSAGTTMSEPWTRFSNNNSINQLDFKWKFDSDWTFRQGLFKADSSMSQPYAITPSMNSNPSRFGETLTSAWRQFFVSNQNQKNTSSQTELYGDVKTGDVKHKILVGYEYSQSKWNVNSNAYLQDFILAPYWNTFNLLSQSPQVGQTGTTNYGWTQNTNSQSNAIYLQNQMSWRALRVLGGIRSEKVNSTNTLNSLYTGNLMGFTQSALCGGSTAPCDPGLGIGTVNPVTSTSNTSQTDSATTGRFGLLYMFTPSTSGYYSWSQSFTPNAAYQGAGGSILPSQRGVQNELGVKHNFWQGLDGTISVFNITKNNVPVVLNATAGTYTVNGQQQSQGWEAGLVGQATSSLKIIANATGLNAKVTQDSNPANIGARLYGVPQFSANFWGVQDLRLDIPGKVSIGAGAVYVGQRAAAVPNLSYFTLPEYTSIDAGVFYKIDRVNLALNVKNITGATILNSVQGTGVNRYAGTTYLATAGINF